MFHKPMKKLFICLSVSLFIISMSCNGFAGGSFAFAWGNETEDHQVKHEHKYRYYPDSKVYYDTNRKLYYYLENDNWKSLASLPSNYRGELGDYVTLEMDTDKPYVYHDKHTKEFPPRGSKKRKKGLSKVIFFLLYEHAPK